jgi:hypothetical protein
MRPVLLATALLLLALLGIAETGTTAPATPVDAHGAVRALPLIAAQSACFGGASRDPQRPPCRDSRLENFVYPRPALAQQLPNGDCDPAEREVHMSVCSFGAEPEDATETVVLVGDSHAGHWRAGLDVVARARGWRGLSITHSSCPLSKAVRDLEEAERFKSCAAWKRAVFAWFERHPEIKTVFVGGLTGGSGVFPRRGEGRFATSVRGYRRAWRALPSTVQRVVVIRDTPKMRIATAGCVERALADGRRAGASCAMSRRTVLDRDPMVAAASQMPPSFVRTIDLTRFFCDRGPCYPVIGGALVLRDQNHMTEVFSTSLGPYLERKVDALWASWR